MQIEEECLDCIFNQSNRVSKFLKLTNEQATQISQIAKQHIKKFDHTNTPPHNATPMYEAIAEYLKVDDIYADMKNEASQKAQKFSFTCKEAIDAGESRLKGAIKTAIAGNVLDLAAEVIFDLDEEIKNIFKTNFAIDDFESLKEKLDATKKLVYLADNAGEEIFDKICIETIKEIYPKIEVFYFVRGKPIINDLTVAHAKKSGLDKVATLIDSGVPTPGYAIDFADSKAHEIFKNADCIIAKGMGNYECLGVEKDYPIYFLLKVKCQVVARAIGANLGDIVCKKL